MATNTTTKTRTRTRTKVVDPDVQTQPRLNVNINTLTADALQEYKTAKGISLTETVRRLIGIGHFIWKAQQEGKEILLKKGDDTERVIFDF